MDFSDIEDRGLVLLGCGQMGSAMLAGWLEGGLDPRAVWVVDPYPSDWLKAQGVSLNADSPAAPSVLLVAVKPQAMDAALPQAAAFGGGATLIVSIAAGTPIARYEAAFGPGTPVVRTMPNTPASVRRGITALIGNSVASQAHMALAEGLMSAVGQTVRLEDEAQMDAVTAVSGSGPAYVFHLIETLAAAGEAQGLKPALAMALARATVAGAGDLAEKADDSPAQLRINVTSPAGTTEAALKVLMHRATGLPALMARAVKAAADRSRELGVMSEPIDFADFLKVDIRVGRITRAEAYPQAHKPAIKLWIDLGAEIGEKKGSAQLTAHYDPKTLLGRQVLAVVNFPPRQIGKVMSEVLVLGVPDADGGVVLLAPDRAVPEGGRMY